MTTTLPRRVWAATVGDLIDLALAQPHQVMLSTGSVAIMAQFAAHSGIVDPRVGYCIAIGIEWAYLRGLASAAKSPTRWAATLNWSAFAVVVLWGVLWVATVYGALPTRPTGGAAFWLAVAHVVPIAWLSLCSAMCHQAGAARAAREAEDDRRWHRELERKAEERRALIDTKVYAREQAIRLSAANSSQAVQTASGTAATITAEQVARTLREHPDKPKAQVARELGIGRTRLYELIKEAQQRGLL
jgi:hypothetical protein